MTAPQAKLSVQALVDRFLNLTTKCKFAVITGQHLSHYSLSCYEKHSHDM